jgi:TonB family protein
MRGAVAGLKSRIGFLAIACVTLARPAWADPSDGTASPAPPESALGATPPPPPPNYKETPECAKFLPPDTTIPRDVNPTVFSFRLPTTGVMQDIALVKSSGNDTLDKAVLACADGRKSSPMRVAGVPAEITWVWAYFWRPRYISYFSAVTTSGSAEVCDQKQYPYDDIRKGIQGSAKISFRISPDGSATNVQLLQSTGAADLDQISINCVSSWHFYPVMQNGKPVEIDKTVTVGWHLWM